MTGSVVTRTPLAVSDEDVVLHQMCGAYRLLAHAAVRALAEAIRERDVARATVAAQRAELRRYTAHQVSTERAA